MSWGVKTTCFKAPGVSLGGSGVSIGGVRSLRALSSQDFGNHPFPNKYKVSMIGLIERHTEKGYGPPP